MKKKDIKRLSDSGTLSYLDIHFARYVTRLAGLDDSKLFLAAALVSSYTRKGHICLDLSGKEKEPLLEKDDRGDSVACPELDAWQESLWGSSVVGKPGEYKPLILDNKSRLYLHRYWEYQEKLAIFIKIRAQDDQKDVDRALLQKGLERFFPGGRSKETDWQKVAAFTSLIKRFCVISGGPGTGKTSTVAKILALLLEQSGQSKLRIALAAPTGKAAAGLQEAIEREKKKGKSETGFLDISDSIKAAIPDNASTIHRLLGSIPNSPYFRYNKDNLLPVDVLVVDEASMVDLALMSKLIQALTSQARLILLGDKDQLASVEAGSVLGDICDSSNIYSFSERYCRDFSATTGSALDVQSNQEDESGIGDCIVQLQKNYRFGSDSGINEVSHAINQGDADLTLKTLKTGKLIDIQWKELPRPDALAHVVKHSIVPKFEEYLRAGNALEAFRTFERFRILCALRKGPFGSIALNNLVEQILKTEKLIKPDREWYHGRPVLITSNNYQLGLFNGDVGIVLQDYEANNELRVFFHTTDGKLRKLHPLRLPEHETVYAMTVHKSQGSEFDKLLLLLPDTDSPVLTKELIYTGITRARKSVEVWGTESVFRVAVSRRIQRSSGLLDALGGR